MKLKPLIFKTLLVLLSLSSVLLFSCTGQPSGKDLENIVNSRFARLGSQNDLKLISVERINARSATISGTPAYIITARITFEALREGRKGPSSLIGNRYKLFPKYERGTIAYRMFGGDINVEKGEQWSFVEEFPFIKTEKGWVEWH